MGIFLLTMYIINTSEYIQEAYQEFQDILLEHGGILLAENFLGYRKKHLFQCSQGHIIEKKPRSFFNVKVVFCNICDEKEKKQKETDKINKLIINTNKLTAKNNKTTRNNITIDNLHILAAERDGYCLSTVYKRSSDKYTWKCKQDHVWQATFRNVRNLNKWCQKCYHLDRVFIPISLEEKNKRINEKLKNLNIEAIEVKPLFLLKCNICSSEWKRRALPKTQGCPFCKKNYGKRKIYKKRIGTKNLNDYILLKEGTLLEKEYLGYRVPHRIRCKENHKWTIKPHDLLTDKSWCKACVLYGNRVYNFESLNFYAKKFEGVCFSRQYLGYGKNHKFVCKNGHHFLTSLNRIISRGHWCSHCDTNNHVEERVRRAFNKIFGCKFVRVNPKWLKKPGARHACQLDGYNEKRKIAFEYNGKQHDHVVDYIKRDNEEKLRIRQLNDKFKRHMCNKKNIALLTISWKDVSTLRNIAIACLKAAENSKLPLKTTSLDEIIEAIRLRTKK